MKKINKNDIKIGDICCFKSKTQDETIQGEILAIKDATWSKILNGEECYKKYKNNQFSEKDMCLEQVVIEKDIITVYGWVINENPKIKNFFGETLFSCSHYDIFIY